MYGNCFHASVVNYLALLIVLQTCLTSAILLFCKVTGLSYASAYQYYPLFFNIYNE